MLQEEQIEKSELLKQPKEEFMGHPKGLAYIVFTETWERFSFYGMQALLVLYMSSYLLHPENSVNVVGFSGFETMMKAIFGDLSIRALATQTFGLYVGLVYFMPVIGGWLGDQKLGQKKAVLIGGVFMAAGHFTLAFEASFLIALVFLIIGSGFLKGNLAAQVGRLYEKNDQRRDDAFSLYCMAINMGAFIAPLICGTLGELYGWHYGFGVAGIGMLVGIAIYLKGSHHLPDDVIKSSKEDKVPLKEGEGRVIFTLCMLFIIAALYWTAQMQVWTSYPLWIKDRVMRDLFDTSVPVTWFQSLDSLAVLVLAPIVIWMWSSQRKRKIEPSDLKKIAIGCTAISVAYLWLALGEYMSEGAGIALYWPVVFHFICAIAFLYVGPTMLAIVSRCAPDAVNAMMVGSYYLCLFVGGIFSGWLGQFYEKLPPSEFWFIHAVIVGAGAVLILIFWRFFAKGLRLEE